MSAPRMRSLPPDLRTDVDLEAGGTAAATTCYLYFLVCAASEGPLAGLMKVGITEQFSVRHHHHLLKWDAFDLGRSALLRVDHREEARWLENTLRHLHRDPEAERQARAQGKILTTEDFIALDSNRRHPGRCGEGYTEFYAAACLPDMLAVVETWLACRQARRPGLRLVRGIDPAACARSPAAGGGTGHGSAERDRGPGLRTRQRERRAREQRQWQEQVVIRMGQILDFARAHQERLLWINLRGWQRLRQTKERWFSNREAMVDLYFARFAPLLRVPADRIGREWEEPPPGPAQERFEAQVARLVAPAGPPVPYRWQVVRPEQVCSFVGLTPQHVDVALPHPLCRNALLLRIDPWLGDPEHPLLADYQRLAQTVAERHRWEQPPLC